MKIAVFGTGYWAQFQIAAWQSIGEEVVAVWNRSRDKAEDTAARFNIPFVGQTPDEVFESADFDVADIITDAAIHEELVHLATRYRKPVISQKPMALTSQACDRMVQAAEAAGIWFAVHENFRYQPPLQKLKQLLDEGCIGRPIRAQLQLKSPDRAIMDKQPALKAMDHMALMDMGPHIFDVARYLFGEAETIYTRTKAAYADIGAADTASSLLSMKSGLLLSCDLVHEFHHKAFIEGEAGSLLLDRENVIQLQTDEGPRTVDTRTWKTLEYIPSEDWLVHGGHVFSAIPACLEALRDAFLKGIPADTSGRDNRETMRLVFAAVRSCEEGRAVRLDESGI